MNLLLRGQAVGDAPSPGSVYAALYTSADPRRGVAPGETVQFGMSVAPDGGASRGCAYLPEEPLAAVGEIVGVQGLEYFPASAGSGSARTPGSRRRGCCTCAWANRPRHAASGPG